MNKSELVSSVAELADFTKAESEKAVEAVFASISRELSNGGEVRLLGFGTFYVLQRPASEGRNPKTGEKIDIPEKKMPKFRPGKQLKDMICS